VLGFGVFSAVRVDASRMVVDELDIVTAAGILAWVDLGFTLVERLLGPRIMPHTARFVLADPPRRQQSLYQDFTPPRQHGDAVIRDAPSHLHAHLDGPLSIEELARTAMHQRTFSAGSRKPPGLTGTEYLNRARIAKAREFLELTTESVDQVSRSVGYRDVSNFRRLFQRSTGVTPSEYRKRFSIAAREGHQSDPAQRQPLRIRSTPSR
jgi:transcriptional regulator GlxA family with amidase domain